MKVYEFYFTEEGWRCVKDMCSAFGGSMGIHESNWTSMIYEIDGGVYSIPEEEDAADFKRAVEESLRTGKNMLLERYKQFPTEPYDDDSDY